MTWGYLKDSDNEIKHGATMSVYSENSNYPKENLWTLPISQPYRTATGSITSEYILIDLGYDRTVSCIALVNHNLVDGAVITVNYGSDNTVGSTLSGGITYRAGTAWEVFSDITSSDRYWKISIENEENPDGFLSIGYLLIGDYTAVTQMWAYGWEKTRIHNNIRLASEYGTPMVGQLYERNHYRLPLINVTETNMDSLVAVVNDLDRDVTPLFFIPDTSDTDGYFGRFAVDPSIKTVTKGGGNYIQSANFEFLEDGQGKAIATSLPFIYNVGDSVTGLNITRADTANYTDENGVVQSAASGTVRDAHYPQPGTRTLLIEGEARTNAVTDPENLDNGGWNTARCSIAAGDATAPDGTTNGFHKIVEDGTAGNTHYIWQNTGDTETADTDQPISFYVKADERDHIQLRYVQKDGNNQNIVFDLGNKDIHANPDNLRYIIEELADGRLRVGAVFDSGAGANNPQIIIYLHNGTTPTYNGDGSSGLYVWGVMHEIDGDWISPGYDSAIRTAETAVYWDYDYAPNPLTIYCRFIETGMINKDGAKILHIGKSDDSDSKLFIKVTPTNFYRFGHDTGSAVVSSLSSNAPVEGDVVELVACLYEDGAVQLHQKINGGTTESATKSAAAALDTAWSDTKIYLGMVDTVGCVQFQSLKMVPGIHTDFTYLRELTQANYHSSAL